MAWEQQTSQQLIAKKEETNKKLLDDIETWILNDKQKSQKIVTLIYGSDGSGKSGITLNFPTKDGEKIVILDLDGGDLPVAETFHKEKLLKGEIIIKDPTTINMETGDIDYDETFKKIKLVTEWVKKNYEKQNIKLFVIDGISTLLKYAEFKMRDYFKKTVTDGIETRFWKVRSQTFLEVLTLAKAIPINVIFIAHEDFISKDDKELSAVGQRTNQMAFQKIRCIKKEDKDHIVYTAIIDKQKYSPITEGQQINFLSINKIKKEIKWEGSKLWNTML